jgi:hypothetical protein
VFSTEMEKSSGANNGVTVSDTVVEWLVVPLLPITVKVYGVLLAATVPVLMVMVEEVLPLDVTDTDVGLNDTEASPGKPEADMAIV